MVQIVPMERSDPFFKLRLPEHLRERLEKEADSGRRSLTAEILQRLEMSFSDIGERLNALEKEVFDGNRGNENLESDVRILRREMEELSHGISSIYRSLQSG